MGSGEGRQAGGAARVQGGGQAREATGQEGRQLREWHGWLLAPLGRHGDHFTSSGHGPPRNAELYLSALRIGYAGPAERTGLMESLDRMIGTAGKWT